MTGILVAYRESKDFDRNRHFALVKRIGFETQSDVLKAMISESYVWRVSANFSASELTVAESVADNGPSEQLVARTSDSNAAD